MTAIQAVFIATGAAVVISIALIVAGVAVLAGAGWALVTTGGLIAPISVATAVVLLRDSGAGT